MRSLHQKARKEIGSFSTMVMNSHVMSTNSGYYVAAVTCSGGGGAETPVKYATLLQPDDSLHIGQDYRLVSFEEVLREFGSKKRVRLSRIIQRWKEREERKTREGGADEVGNSSLEMLLLDLASFSSVI